MTRAPATASAASTQKKSIASMHSSLSLAVGYNEVVTHSRRSCDCVVANLAKDKTPSLPAPPSLRIIPDGDSSPARGHHPRSGRGVALKLAGQLEAVIYYADLTASSPTGEERNARSHIRSDLRGHRPYLRNGCFLRQE